MLVDGCKLATWVIFKSALVAGLSFSDDCIAPRLDRKGDGFVDSVSVGRLLNSVGKAKNTCGPGSPGKPFTSPLMAGLEALRKLKILRSHFFCLSMNFGHEIPFPGAGLVKTRGKEFKT